MQSYYRKVSSHFGDSNHCWEAGSTPTSGVTSVTIWYIRPPHHGHTSQYHVHEWMTDILFVPCQSAILFLRWGYFKYWPWNSKVKVMGVVKGQGDTVGSVSYQFASFSFHIKQTNNSWDTAISNFDLETSKVKVMSKVKVTYYTHYQTDAFTFLSNRSDKPFPTHGQNSFQTWKNISKIFKENLLKYQFQTELLRNLIS